MSSSKTEFVVSKETDNFVNFSNIQLMYSLPTSLDRENDQYISLINSYW